jgi:hypothetical protein
MSVCIPSVFRSRGISNGRTNVQATSIINAARSAYAAGLSLLPTRDDGSKAPDVPGWREYQTTRPTVDEMRAFNFSTRSGFGVIAGAVSQHRETWDFDDLETYRAFVEAAEACGLGDAVRRIVAGFENETPGGGRRWIVTYPPDVDARDVTLARRPGRNGEPKVKTLIELPTFAIVAPSNGNTHPSGRPYRQLSGGFDTIAAYTHDERDALIALARSFDRMPRREAPSPAPRSTPSGDRPGDAYNERVTWRELLEPAGWTIIFERGEVAYWRRPGKDFGISATTNYGGSDLFFPFTSSTEFEPEKSFSKFAVYATLHHRGDYAKAALALSKQGFGRQDDLPVPKQSAPTTPCTLTDTIAVFRRWLSLGDPSPVYAVAATLVANRAPGDPVWLLLVCAPSTGKTEILSAATRLPWVIPAAKVTEASLLSGTSKRERTTGATGGLLRQVGDFGVLLCKDFTSVLAQNKDARAEAMAGLREVYDGEWHRPVGTDGGRVLTWRGKCGLIGGVTPALDQYGQVLSSLGDRFLLLRLPDANVDDFGAAALRHGEQEHQMRHELREALAGLVEHADKAHVNRALDAEERRRLIRLAAYTARTRTAVVRDGYRQDVVYLPQVEGPGRLVKAYARLLGGLEAIGCDQQTAWETLTRIAIDCAPALRTKVIRELVKRPARVRTSDIAAATDIVTKTASRYLEDLTLLKLAERTKLSKADNSPDYWEASAWLRDYWPEGKTEKYVNAHANYEEEGFSGRGEHQPHPSGACSQTSPSHSANPDDLPACLRELTELDASDPIGAHDEDSDPPYGISREAWARHHARKPA